MDTLLLSDPFFTSFLNPLHHNTPSMRSESSPAVRAFSPNFDIHETPKEFVLEGEFPGLDDKHKNLTLEFTDNNTLVIRGKIERSLTSGTPPTGMLGMLEGSQMKGAITEEGEETSQMNKPMGEKKEKMTERMTEKMTGKMTEKMTGKKDNQEEPIKYWVSERTVGSFQRSFSFPGEVDQENVKASLEHGILKVVVPKKEKRGSRKIHII